MGAMVQNADSGERVGLFERMMRLEERQRFAAHILDKDNARDEEKNAACAEYVLTDQCVRDLERLQKGDYYFDYPTRVAIPKSNSDRMRILYIFRTGNEHALLRLITYGLRPLCTTLPSTLYSFRSDKSSVELIRDAHSVYRSAPVHAIRSDVRDYGCSMDPDLLISILERYVGDDPTLFNFFKWLLKREKAYEWGELREFKTGGFPGTAVSNFFMAIYLLDIDAAVSAAEGCLYYGRYGDDVVAFFDTEENLHKAHRLFLDEIAAHKLTLNPDKTGLVGPDEPIELMGVEMCGTRVYPCERGMNRLKKRLRRRAQEISIRKKKEGLSDDEAGRLIVEAVNRTFYNPDAPRHTLTWARWAFPLITDGESLKELDAYAQKCIRYVMTGTWGKGQYRVRYSKLQALGYVPQNAKYYRRSEGDF